jgi:hypothetical protein
MKTLLFNDLKKPEVVYFLFQKCKLECTCASIVCLELDWFIVQQVERIEVEQLVANIKKNNQ